MAKDDRRTRGETAFEKIMGFPVPSIANDPFLAATVEHLFAEVWTRPALSVRDRRLITLTVLMTMAHEPTLRLHLSAALRSKDLTPAEVDELILHVAHYAGWPPAALAAQIARQLRADDPDTR
jgi:4-carboxymuconolactone decarboxylase